MAVYVLILIPTHRNEMKSFSLDVGVCLSLFYLTSFCSISVVMHFCLESIVWLKFFYTYTHTLLPF